MNTISKRYALVWQLKDATEYKFTRCKKCFNAKNGKQLKMIMVGGSIGFCIKGKFRTLQAIRGKLEKIEKQFCPF
jgi:hypothetical protein